MNMSSKFIPGESTSEGILLSEYSGGISTLNNGNNRKSRVLLTNEGTYTVVFYEAGDVVNQREFLTENQADNAADDWACGY
ncbi:MAG: hypothetical protein EBY41_00825 [Proteobacteria bacterium]|nr:hypothetical protein [Pseudomonadota bacterium]